MLIPHVAIVSETDAVPFERLSVLSAAIQKQVARDFGPLWNIQATVDAFVNQADVPVDYWHVVIMDDIHNPAALGFHKTKNNQPFALVQFDEDDWTVTVSHEILEMLADPSGDRLVAGQSVQAGQGRVQYTVEVCDPVQHSFYRVNETNVCDFYTPHYFDPVAAPGVRYGFTDALREPLQVLEGGYLTFLDPATGRWWQKQWFDGAAPTIVDLSGPQGLAVRVENPNESLREVIDRITPSKQKTRLLKRSPAGPPAKPPTQFRESGAGNANVIREAIHRVLSDRFA